MTSQSTSEGGFRREAYPVTWALVEACVGDLRETSVEVVRDRSLEAGVGRLVRAYLEGRGVEVGAFDDSRRRLALRNATLRGELGRVWPAVRGEAEAILMKGEAFNELFFGDLSLRDYGDIDLLVRRGAVEAVSEALGELGYEPMPDRADPWRDKAYPHRRPDSGLTVDLHWKPVYSTIPHASTEALFDRSQMIEVGRGEQAFSVRTLGMADTFLHTCYHYFLHVGFLKGVVDVALFLDRCGTRVNPEEIRATCEELGVCNLVAWPLGVLEEAVGGDDMHGSRREEVLGPWLETFGDVMRRPRVRWASRQWAAEIEGRLARDESIRSRSMVGFKATGLLKGTRMLWKVASMGLLDRPGDAVRGMLEPVFVGPEKLAGLAGREEPAVRDYLHTVVRPGILVVKQIGEMFGSGE